MGQGRRHLELGKLFLQFAPAIRVLGTRKETLEGLLVGVALFVLGRELETGFGEDLQVPAEPFVKLVASLITSAICMK